MARSLVQCKSEEPLVASSCPHELSTAHNVVFFLRCDGAFKNGKVAIGVILHGSNEMMVDGIAKKIPSVSSLFSETAAIRDACLLASATDLLDATVVSDNLEMI
ncbi:unnamed protein product, partial [Ilex paraguariensis]